MKIELPKNRKIFFKDVEPGDCFKWCELFFLKTKEKGAAISLDDGEKLFFNDVEYVIPVGAKIVVE